MNLNTIRVAATGLSLGLLVGSAVPTLTPTQIERTMTNQTPFTQPLRDLGSCILRGPADAQRNAIIGTLISQGYADDSLYQADDALVINLAKQFVVGNCGPDAWSGE